MDDELLSKREVATLLNVSPLYVDKLMDVGKLDYVISEWDDERRVRTSVALAYKREMKKRQAAGLEQIVRASHELGLYDGK